MAANSHMESEKTKTKKKKNTPHWPRPRNIRNAILEEISTLQDRYKTINESAVKTFNDFPLSEFTRKGLKEHGYKIPTEIQRESVGIALKGKDVLGAAQTGSGKTLAFLIPVIESLFCKQWTRMDGIGGLIITPTRELAYQIFETLKKIGKHHELSAGLVIGGKDLHFEKSRMDQCNIVICTPGRILHHMDINPLFNCSSLQILVLDEADRCLDMGFEATMNSIIENLPPKRQTLLFSATQTKSVKDLARLSLKNPSYVSVHENKEFSTPDSLEQSYIVCELHDKINMLWSFIKNHKRQKILIFLSSCKQVKYLYSLFCRLRPGSPLLALYGTLHQLRRMKIYNEFCSKQNVILFATDIAARGLDFPEVNWVVQLDCPEDATTYIHRAGRTARYSKGGESLLILLPSEEAAMVESLKEKRIPISKIEVNQTKLSSPIRKIEALLARDPELKTDAQRAFTSYIKSVFLMKNKEIFKVNDIDLEKFASSLGLAVTPKIRFLRKKLNDVTSSSQNSTNAEESNSDGDEAQKANDEVKKAFNFHANSDEEDDVIKIKRRDHNLEGEDLAPIEEIEPRGKTKKALTKAAVAKRLLKKKIVANKKTVFDESGEAVASKGRQKFSEVAQEYENADEAGIDIAKAKEILRIEDKFDKKLFRDRVKEKHKEEKRKLKQTKKKDRGDDDAMDVRLGSGSDDGSEPDTSWIPDPDKFKNDKGDDDDDEGSSDRSDSEQSDGQSDSEVQPVVKRRKVQLRKEINEDDDDNAGFKTGLSLLEDEEIALRVLQAGR